MTATTATDSYRAARDLLLDLREDPDRAHAEFSWPDVGRPVQLGGRLVRRRRPGQRQAGPGDRRGGRPGDRAHVRRRWRRRSDQVAAWLAGQGVARGDAVILMLGNQVELWESMLAIMKLGAVIMPTTTARRARRPRRPHRAGRRAVRDLQPRRRRQVRRRPRRVHASLDAPSGCSGLRRSTSRPAEHPGTAPSRPAAALLHLRHDVASRSSSSTRRSPTRSATCRRCTGSACVPATCT